MRGGPAGRRTGTASCACCLSSACSTPLLAISFLTLVWTGFALKYPDQWWARPLLLMEGRYTMRSLIHRVAAAVFIAVSLTHLVSLIVNRKLREHWKEMLPNTNDPREALSNFAYNLGLGDTPPGRSPHSYVEKAEYWAVVWGAVVMAPPACCCGPTTWPCGFCPRLAGRGHFGALLRGPAGHPGDCGLALLLGDFRSRRLPAEHRLSDRAAARRKKNRPPHRPLEAPRAKAGGVGD